MEVVLLATPQLLFRPHRGGNLPKINLEERFRMSTEGKVGAVVDRQRGA